MNRITWVITGAVLPSIASEFLLQGAGYLDYLIWITLIAWSVFAAYKRAENMLGKGEEYLTRRIFLASGPVMLDGILILREAQNYLREDGADGGWLTPIGITLAFGIILTYGMLALVPPIEGESKE